MAEAVIMPKAGMSMEEGTVVRWLKKEGEPVQKGETLLEIETDKAVMELEAEKEGYLIAVLVHEGETVPVTSIIGYIGGKDEPLSDASPKTVVAENAGQAEKTPVNTETEIVRQTSIQNDTGKAAATPLARTLAKEKGIEIAAVQATGSRGEVKARDVKTAAQAAETVCLPGPLQAVSKPLTGMRRTIASRMLKSHLEVPPVTIDMRAEVTGLCRLKEQLHAAANTKITYNDLIIKATAMTLRQCPEINVSFANDHLICHDRIHIGMAVAMDDGLIVPVIRDADTLGIKEISAAAGGLADRARKGMLKPEEYSGGTFTISNMGMYGVRSFTPIINPPEAAILGVCAIEKMPALDERGGITEKQYMGLSLSFDHRCMDGAQAALFLKKLIDLLEHPMLMLIQ